MIWRWLICFSGFGAASAGLLAGASLSGHVELTNSRNAAARKHDYSGVVLWLEAAGGAAARTAPPHHAEMKQRDKSFVPHVLAIPVGGSVDFPNLDPIYHSAFSNFSGTRFDVGLYAPGTSQNVVFRTAGIVHVFCNIHPTMSAIIAVVPTAWYDVTGASGKYAIAGVPPGDYQLRLFHERALPENLAFLERRISVPESGLVLPLISISETGFVPAPHLNKYGHPYPPDSPEGPYSGGK
jgi:plastocyanin